MKLPPDAKVVEKVADRADVFVVPTKGVNKASKVRHTHDSYSYIKCSCL